MAEKPKKKLADGTLVDVDIAAKTAECDADGNNISSKYATKTELTATRAELIEGINGKANSNHTHSIATSSTAGFVKSSTTGTTANRDYNVQVNADGTMKVNVPWTDVGGDGGGITCTRIFEGAGEISGYYTQTLSDGDYKILLFEVNVNNVYFYLSVPTYNSKYSTSTFYLVAGNTNNGSIGIVEITASNTNFSATVSNGNIVINNVNVYAYK